MAHRSTPWLACCLALAAAGCTSHHQATPLSSAAAPPRTALLASINDTYRLEGIDEGTRGGFARVRSLRKELEREFPDLLMLHGGDLFFPSLLSRIYRGEQMVDGLNMLDGQANVFDSRLFLTFGNHEFDRGRLEDAATVQSRVGESHFTWLGGNIRFGTGADGKPLVAGPNLVGSTIVESGGIKIGLFGVTIQDTVPAYAAIDDPFEAARRLTAELKAQGAEVVVGLTHLGLADDVAIPEKLGEAGPHLILGGHEHSVQLERVGERYVCKADSDALSACLVKVSVDANGRVTVAEPVHRVLSGNDPAPDPEMTFIARHWLALHEQKFCAQTRRPPGCLGMAAGRTQTELGGEETEIRAYETTLGNWLTDQMLAAFKDEGAQVAFMNSGSLRLNHDLAAGATIRERELEELFGFSTKLRLIKITGADLQKIADHSVEQWPGKGWWLQVAGFAFRYDNDDQGAYDLTLLTSQGPRPVDPNEEILAVASEFLTNPSIGNQDGYTMLKPDQVVAEGPELIDLVRQALKAAEPLGIAPKLQGRICNPGDILPCLAAEVSETE